MTDKLTTAQKALSPAPCDVCGYNGPGYYQPETHPCAAMLKTDRAMTVKMTTAQMAEAWVAELGDIQQYGLKISAEIITALLKENRALLDASKSVIASKLRISRNTVSVYIDKLKRLERAIAMCEEKL